MELQKLYSYARQAIEEYHMIAEGDRIALGISGGKDSLALLYAMAGLRSFYPKHFEIIALTADLGYGTFDLSEVERLCRELQVEYHIVRTQIGTIVQEKIPSGSYCSLCSKLRKGALHSVAAEYGCNKIAYAHHRDDLIETMLLSLIYEGQFYTFSPVTCFERAGLTVIRPFLYIPEAELTGFRNKYQLPCVKNPCPHDGITRRQYVKDLLRQLRTQDPRVSDRLFSAIVHGQIEGWPDCRDGMPPHR